LILGDQKSAWLLLLLLLPILLYSVSVSVSEIQLLAPVAHLQQVQQEKKSAALLTSQDTDTFQSETDWQPLSSRLCAYLGQAEEWLSQGVGVLPDAGR